MAIPRIVVNDYIALGNLFIEWSLDNTKAPTDLAGFINKVVTPGIVDPLPGYIQTFVPIFHDSKQLVIRIPPADLVQDTLTNIKNHVPYDFPPESLYRKRLVDGTMGDLDFFGLRVGDYTIARCS